MPEGSNEEEEEYLFTEPGKYKFTINANEEAQWISLVKIGEYIPNGGSIEYKFQTSNDRKTLSEETDKIENLARSQYVRVLVTMNANSQGESPKIKGIYMKFLTDHKMQVISKNENEQIIRMDAPIDETVKIELPINITINGETSTVMLSPGINTPENNPQLPANVSANVSVSYSEDGVNWVNTPESGKTYPWVKINNNITTGPNVTVSTGIASPATKTSQVQTAQIIPEWETVDYMYYFADATTTAGEWVSIEPEQYLPNSNTKLTYQFAKSNDFESWSSETEEVEGAGQMPVIEIGGSKSQFLRVKVNFKVLKAPNARVKKLPRVDDMIINYKVNDENYTNHMTVSSDTQIYKITYNPNGANGNDTYSIFTAKNNTTKLRENPYSRDNYTFLGWCEDAQGDGNYYSPGEEFQVTGKNYTLYAVWCENVIMGNEGIIGKIDDITETGNYTIDVTGNTGEKSETVTYNLHVIVYNDDLVLDGKMDVNGAILENNVYSFGSTEDLATATEQAQNTVVLKVNGNLTVESGVTLTTVRNTYGGPKGLLIYCNQNLINKGEISMTARGAKASGQNVFLYQNKNGSYEYVPKEGATGGASIYYYYHDYWDLSSDGNKGNDGTGRHTGGGGTGAGRSFMAEVNIGKGGTGTSYSGGCGSGASNSDGGGGWTANSSEGSSEGGAGSNGIVHSGNSSGYGQISMGGTGNPSGGYESYRVNANNYVYREGTGGLLIIYCSDFDNQGSITSHGVSSSTANRSNTNSRIDTGGASGGGSINIFYLNIRNRGSITATGGEAIQGEGGHAGGAGGNGTANIGSIQSGNYEIYYSNN